MKRNFKPIRRILSFALCLCMVLGILPTVGFAADVDLPDNLYVGGTAVITDGTLTANTSGSNWKFDASTVTLYLYDGADIRYTSNTGQYLENGICCSGGTLNIQASGTVNITGRGTGIDLPSGTLNLYAAEGAVVTVSASYRGFGIKSTVNETAVTISGKGTVNVYGAQTNGYYNSGIYAAGNVTIDGVTLNAKGCANFPDIAGNKILIGQTESAVVNCLGKNGGGLGDTLTQLVGIYNGSRVYFTSKTSGDSWLTGVSSNSLEIVDSSLIVDGLLGYSPVYAMHSTTTVSGSSHILVRSVGCTNNSTAHGITTGSAGYELTATSDYYCRTDATADFTLNPDIKEIDISHFELYTAAHHGYQSNGDGTHYYGCPTDCLAVIKGENEACGGTATCAERAFCEACGTVYGEMNGSNHADPYTPEFRWYEPYETDDGKQCYVELYLYCTACDSEYSAGYDSGYAKLTERVEPADCKTPGTETYEFSFTYEGMQYPATMDFPVYSYSHLEYDADGFCTICGGYQPAAYNEAENVYEISNAGQLYWYAQELNENNSEIYAELTEDITIPATAPNWQPITASYAYFNGNYHTISGLNCVGTDMTYVGLFGNEDWWYEISNLHITNSYFEGGRYVGAVVASMSNGGSVTNCYVTNTTIYSDGSSVGGVVGYNFGTVTNCYAYIDGIPCVGYNSSYSGGVTNCFYLSETETEDGGKTAKQFASGEVAYLLQAGQAGEPLWDEENQDYFYDDEGNYIYGAAPHVWGQTIGSDSYPVFGGKKVYEGLACDGVNLAYSNTVGDLSHNYENIVSNGNGTHSITCTYCNSTVTEKCSCSCADLTSCWVCGGAYEVSAGQAKHNVDINGLCAACGETYQATLNGTYYHTLKEAIIAANAIATMTSESELVVIANTVLEYEYNTTSVLWEGTHFTVNEGVTLEVNYLTLRDTVTNHGTIKAIENSNITQKQAIHLNRNNYGGKPNLYGNGTYDISIDSNGGILHSGTYLRTVNNYNSDGEILGGNYTDIISRSGLIAYSEETMTISGTVYEYNNSIIQAVVTIEGEEHTHTPGETTCRYKDDKYHELLTPCTTCPFKLIMVDEEEHTYTNGYCICEDPEPYNIIVSGVEVTAANASDIMGDGTVVYDHSTQAMILNNAELPGDILNEYGYGIIAQNEYELNLVLIGENKITAPSGESYSVGILQSNALNITGSGSLTVTTNSSEILSVALVSNGLSIAEETSVTTKGLSMIMGEISVGSSFHAIVFNGADNYTVYGNGVLTEDLTVDYIDIEDERTASFTISEGASLTIEDGVTLTIAPEVSETAKNSIVNHGNVILNGSGTIVNNGYGTCSETAKHCMSRVGVCLICSYKMPILQDVNLSYDMAISAGAEMQVVYTIPLMKVNGFESFCLEVVKEVVGGESITTVFSIDDGNLTAITNPKTGAIVGYQATYTGIFASEMGDNFTTTLYCVENDGTIRCSTAKTASIKSYLYEKLADSKSGDELKTLVVDMLNYGAAAQIYFDYDAENLVNADLTEEQKALGTQNMPAAVDGSSADGNGLNISTSISLQSKVMLYLTCMYTSNEDSNLKFVVKDSDGNVLKEFAASLQTAQAYQGIYSDVGARHMRELLTIELYDNDVLVSEPLTWSVESYVAQIRADSASSAELIAIANAMLTYGDSAATYLEASGQ